MSFLWGYYKSFTRLLELWKLWDKPVMQQHVLGCVFHVLMAEATERYTVSQRAKYIAINQ